MPLPRGHSLLKFVRMVPPFNAGETAALPYERANALVKMGAALFVNPPAGLDAAGAPAPKESKELPEGIWHKGGGYYVIGVDSDGVDIIVKGRDEALEAFAALEDSPGDDDDGGWNEDED